MKQGARHLVLSVRTLRVGLGPGTGCVGAAAEAATARPLPIGAQVVPNYDVFRTMINLVASVSLEV